MLKIGNLTIKYNAMLAPLAALTDIVFRRLIDEIGYSGFMVTEMISVEGLRRMQAKTLDMIRPASFRTPQFIQLFGGEPEPFIDAVKYVENETDFQGIDINMGCPAMKVIKRGAGSALLRTPAQIALILRTVKQNTSLPVTVKIRLGFQQVNVFEVVRILEEEGADAITVHFRLRCQGYSGQADWQYAPQIRHILKPETVFFGNGDIKTASEAQQKMEFVNGVMIGRAAVINPLIFAEIAGASQPGADNPEPLNMKWVYQRLLELIEEYYPPHMQLNRLKAFTRFIFSNRKFSKIIRHQIYTAPNYETARELFRSTMLEEYLNAPRQL